ncbi:UNVERIFIED_ORG: hypothetical protein ABIC48_006929 [Burkholderia territorii]
MIKHRRTTVARQSWREVAEIGSSLSGSPCDSVASRTEVFVSLPYWLDTD